MVKNFWVLKIRISLRDLHIVIVEFWLDDYNELIVGVEVRL